MNPRVKELAEQVGGVVLAGNEIQKFAELTVAECISVVDDAERGGSNEIWDNAVKFIRRDIQEHFGVGR